MDVIDAVLRYQAQPQDDYAFEYLVQAYIGLVYRIALRILGSECDAEDATQETFIKVFRSLAALKDPYCLSDWIAATTTRTCLNVIRMRRRRPVSVSFPHDSDEGVVCMNEYVPEPRVLTCELRAHIEFALQQLTPHERCLIVLRDIEQQNYDHIGAIFGVSANCAKTRAHRARVTFRRLLEPYLIA